MCRLLLVYSRDPFDPLPHLRAFAGLCQNSREFQGHGWGCAALGAAGWSVYRDIRPVWTDDLERFPLTTRLLAHARSAFRDEGITVENNMPFGDDGGFFIFNGELHGVRLRAEGRIGAEKIYNLIRRFDEGDKMEAIRKAVRVIESGTRYVKAMNIIISDADRAWANCQFNEDEDYFTLRRRTRDGVTVVCSEPYPGTDGWEKLENRYMGAV
jgi:predicted glutamine amidotransferase